MPCTSLLGWPGIGCHMARGEANRKPACATRHENGPHFAGHSGARAPPASPETMNTSLEDRVHEPVFMASGPGLTGRPGQLAVETSVLFAAVFMAGQKNHRV